jgi:predicted alpha/beta superfamily hydrolase
MKIKIVCVIVALCGFIGLGQTKNELMPKAFEISKAGVSGKLKRYEKFESKFVEARNVDVWLPPDYDAAKAEKYPVLYMHDGQNLFDPELSYSKVDWGVDETMTLLIKEGKVRPAVVVGVWNSPKRTAEYMPQKAVDFANTKDLKNMPIKTENQIISDNYLKFLVEELKPFIDANYRTRRDRENTFVMGSSMGGLISAYAISEYPKVFGGAGCVSTHWLAGDGIVIEYLKKNLPDPRTHKIYFDFGTATLDAGYEPYQIKMDAVMREKGYVQSKNWLTRKFEGAEHSERAWRERVDIPLTFLLGK